MLFRLLIILLIFGILEFYFIKKIKNTLKNTIVKKSSKKTKRFSWLAILYYNLFPFSLIGMGLYYWITGAVDTIPPQGILIDWLLIYPFWVSTLIAFQIMILVIPLDLLKLILFPIYKRHKNKIKKWDAILVLSLLVIFTIYIPGRIIYDLNTVDVRYVEYKKKDLHEDLEGLKIGLISDIQADRYTNNERLDEFVSKLNAQNPDLVLIAGDMITSTPLYIDTAAEYLGKIKSGNGIYASIGDHDNWAYRSSYKRSLREVSNALAENGIPMYDNEHLKLNVDSAKVNITFITDNYVNRINRDKLDSLSNGATHYDLKIFLSHQPNQYLIDAAEENDYDLFLAGHTHGGQVTFFFPFYNLSPTLIETHYVRGDFWFDDMLMIVTPGLGLSLAPVRLNATPEVTMIVLKKE